MGKSAAILPQDGLNEHRKIAAEIEHTRNATAENHVFDLAFAARVLDPALMTCQPALELLYFAEKLSIEARTWSWLHPPKKCQRIGVVFNFDLTKILRIGMCGEFCDSVHLRPPKELNFYRWTMIDTNCRSAACVYSTQIVGFSTSEKAEGRSGCR